MDSFEIASEVFLKCEAGVSEDHHLPIDKINSSGILSSFMFSLVFDKNVN